MLASFRGEGCPILIHGDASPNFQEQNGLSLVNLPVVFGEKCQLSARSASCGGPQFGRPWWPRPAPRQLRRGGGQPLALLGHGREDRLGHLAKDVEGAELMRDLTEDRGDRLGIQRRAVGRDPLEGQPARRRGRAWKRRKKAVMSVWVGS